MRSSVDDSLFDLFDGSVEARRGGGLRRKADRVARGAPEVMVKITGYVRMGGGIKHHIDYISRHGKIECEDENGAVYSGKRDAKDLAEDWTTLSGNPKKEERLTTNIVLSMPPGTEPEAVKAAARRFAAKTFGENYSYVFALHTDENHPHVHLTVLNRGCDGRKLHIPKGKPQEWREAFAEEMRDQDVEAEATPRATRGVVRKKVKSAVHHMRKRGVAARTDARRVKEVMEERNGDRLEKSRPWEEKIAARQRRVRSNWLEAAKKFRETESREDDAFAENVVNFVRNMPPIKTERQVVAERLLERERAAESALQGSQAQHVRAKQHEDEAEL